MSDYKIIKHKGKFIVVNIYSMLKYKSKPYKYKILAKLHKFMKDFTC